MQLERTIKQILLPHGNEFLKLMIIEQLSKF